MRKDAAGKSLPHAFYRGCQVNYVSVYRYELGLDQLLINVVFLFFLFA